MPGHVFVDESKERGYLLAATTVTSSQLPIARQTIRALILPGQRRLHFKHERDARRGQILDAICTLGVQTVIYDGATAPNGKEARRACLAALVADLAKNANERVVIERDDSVLEFDKRLLYREVHMAGAANSLRYDHLRAHEECLLAVPDAVAWCWARGAHWRAKVRAVVAEVRQV